MRNSLPLGAIAVLLVAVARVGVAQQADVDPQHAAKMQAGLQLFRESVRSTLQENCLKCHNARSKKADFDLSTRRSLVESGHLGSSSEDSYLMQLVRHEEEPPMPLKADKLSDQQITALAKWIDLGAPYDKPFENTRAEDESSKVTRRRSRLLVVCPFVETGRSGCLGFQLVPNGYRSIHCAAA